MTQCVIYGGKSSAHSPHKIQLSSLVTVQVVFVMFYYPIIGMINPKSNFPYFLYSWFDHGLIS
jgi:hypothetical protein